MSSLGFGLLISTISRTQQQAGQRRSSEPVRRGLSHGLGQSLHRLRFPVQSSQRLSDPPDVEGVVMQNADGTKFWVRSGPWTREISPAQGKELIEDLQAAAP